MGKSEAITQQIFLKRTSDPREGNPSCILLHDSSIFVSKPEKHLLRSPKRTSGLGFASVPTLGHPAETPGMPECETHSRSGTPSARTELRGGSGSGSQKTRERVVPRVVGHTEILPLQQGIMYTAWTPIYCSLKWVHNSFSLQGPPPASREIRLSSPVAYGDTNYNNLDEKPPLLLL